MTAPEILDRCERVRGAGEDHWVASCPAHPDRVQSLSIGIGADERVLLCCHAGCGTPEIMAALGLQLSDLFITERAPRHHRAGYVRVPALARSAARHVRPTPPVPVVSEDDVARWAIRLQTHDRLLQRIHGVKGWTATTLFKLGVGWDGRRLTLPVRAPGGLLRGVLRYLPGGEPKMLATRGCGRDLWPPPEHYPQRCIIWLVEGEPDAISMAELGYFATAAPGAGRWRDDWTRRLQSHLVVVVADCDAPGRMAAQRAVHELHRHCEVRYVDLDATRCDGHDIGDELAAASAQGDLGVPRLSRALEEAAGFRQRRAA